jgi:hypothetical protein
MGVVLTFMPDLVPWILNVKGSLILFQLLGALYFAFALLN